MTDIDTLVNAYGEENVKKAFWLQQHIKDEGIDEINFMAAARRFAEGTGLLLIKKAIEDEFKRSI